MASQTRLRKDLERWSRQLKDADNPVFWDDVIAWKANRETAMHLTVDVRADVSRRVGGDRTLDAGRGRRKRGYRAGVWTSSLGDGPSWWVGGTGKLHWVDQGTSRHEIGGKGRRVNGRRRKNRRALLEIGNRVVTGPITHPGARGDGLYGRSVDAHAAAAMDFGGASINTELQRAVMPDG